MSGEEDFIKGLLIALKNPAIQATLCDIISTSLKNEIVSLRKELKQKDSKILDLQQQVASLEIETDNLQQYSRRNSLRITGIPETETENVVEKSLAVINETMNVRPQINLNDIDRIHRVGPKTSSNRPMLIKFSTYYARKRVMDGRSRLKQSGLFVNEDLTRRRADICWRARQLKKEGKIQGVWTADGKILIKNNVNRVVNITTTKDLEKEAIPPRTAIAT